MSSYGDVLKASNLVAAVNSGFNIPDEGIALCKDEFPKCISYLENEASVKNPHLVGLFKDALKKVEGL